MSRERGIGLNGTSMIETLMTQTRKGVALNNGATVAVQLSDMSIEEMHYYGGAEPFFRFWLYNRGAAPANWDVRPGDLFTDVNTIDPNTNANAVYRVAGNPNRYLQSVVKIPVELYRGKPK